MVHNIYLRDLRELCVKKTFRPDEYPAQLVKPAGGDLYWLLDEAAASSLMGP